MWELRTTYSGLANSAMTTEAREALDPRSEVFRLRYAYKNSFYLFTFYGDADSFPGSQDLNYTLLSGSYMEFYFGL